MDDTIMTDRPTPDRLAITTLILVAIVVPPLGAAIGIVGSWRASRAGNARGKRWYAAATIVAMADIIVLAAVILVGGQGPEAEFYSALGAMCALTVWVIATRSWERELSPPRGHVRKT
jgi:peptidoglycan/LPS O-acetylase OafA/YrhL